jgi:hypothetical protein
MMTDKQRIEWLASLKVGDKVLIGANSIGIIEKITPKRFFVIDETKYNRDGIHVNEYNANDVIFPWTIEDKKRIEKRNIHIGYIKQIEKINWRKVKFNKLERIINILKEE